jgi:methyl-accepting chemotaxis protein
MKIRNISFQVSFSYFFILLGVILLGDFLILDFLSYDLSLVLLSQRNSVLISVVIVITLVLIYWRWKFGFIFRLMMIGASILIIAAKASLINSFLTYTNSPNAMFVFLTIDSLAIIAIASVALYAYRTVIDPINHMIQVTEQISERNYQEQNLDKIVAQNDELGYLYNSIVSMRSQLKQDFSDLVKTITKTSNSIASISEDLAQSTEEVSSLSEEISMTVEDLSNDAEKQTILVSSHLQDTLEVSKSLETKLEDVTNSLKIVNEISRKTNILSLNAAIEASRAGEYGRGFSVVASNVRELAELTKKHSNHINTAIQDTINEIKDFISEINALFQNLLEKSETLSARNQELASSSEEQTSSMSLVALKAQELSNLGNNLRKHIQQFNVEETVHLSIGSENTETTSSSQRITVPMSSN